MKMEYNIENIAKLKTDHTWKELSLIFNKPWETIRNYYRYHKCLSNKCLNCGISISESKTYCGHSCQFEFQYKEWISEWKRGNKSGLRGEYGTSKYLKKYLFQKFNNKCAKCGWGEVNPYTSKIPLEIEHIDGNYLNNNEDNLILLCPNCHSLTATYKGANKGCGRKGRQKYTH